MKAYRCAKCDFDVCGECSQGYALGFLRSRHHLLPLGRAVLPRGLRSSRRSCAGELLPGGCRCTDREAATEGVCCPASKCGASEPLKERETLLNS